MLLIGEGGGGGSSLTSPVPIADGGTGQITAALARTALGLEIGSNVQAFNNNLSGIAGLTSAADRLAYFTAINGASALTTFTAFARTILADADATTVRSTLGLVIGTDVQAYNGHLKEIAAIAEATGFPYLTGTGAGVAKTIYGAGGITCTNSPGADPTLFEVAISDAELLAIAGLTSAANKLPYFTGAGTAALADLTSFIRTLLDDADASTARATLELVIGTNVQAYHAILAALAALDNTAGLLIQSGASSFVRRTITGTASEIEVANGTGASGNPTISLHSGVYRSGGTDVAITDGGTGASTAAAGFDALAPTTTQGDIIVRGASNNARLGIGSVGQIIHVPSANTLAYRSPKSGGMRSRGMVGYTYNPSFGSQNLASSLASQTMYLFGLDLDIGDTITNIGVCFGSTAANTPTNWWFALYTSALVLMAQTADQTTGAIAAGSFKDIALSSPQAITTSGLHYVGVMVKASTVPTLAGRLAAVDGGHMNFTVAMTGTSDGSLTTTAPANAAAINTIAQINMPLIILT
jgi:hypothetical protein